MTRHAPLDLPAEEFRTIGHKLVDDLAEFLAAMPNGLVTKGESPSQVRAALGGQGLPSQGTDAATLIDEATRLVTQHSLFNGHPRFWGYITSSAAPIGALGDLIAAMANPNVGSQSLAPIATEIEKQTVSWIADLIGYPTDCGGILVSGGNMANMVCFLAARTALLGPDARRTGLNGRKLTIYASSETHTWIQKAADLFGFGTEAIRWIPVDAELRMDVSALRTTIADDIAKGFTPMIVIGTAGSVGTGAIDPLGKIRQVCDEFRVWFHVDGAYGALAAALPDVPADLKALSTADSVAVDPHKWLYSPIEAGCSLVRRPEALRDAFSYHPVYYHFGGGEAGDEPTNFYEYGPQNTRGFRALKVWLGLRQAGRDGYVKMMGDDCELSRALYDRVSKTPLLQPLTQGLSITTFRYVPNDLTPGTASVDAYIDALNTEILTRMQAQGEAYVSNAVVRGAYALRACVVNFRTTLADIEALPVLVVKIGQEADQRMRAEHLADGSAAARAGSAVH